MASGLYIERGRDFHVKRWLSLLVFLAMLGTVGWFGFKWYTTGEKPPFVPLPAAALADPSVDESPVSLTAINNYTVPDKHPRYISIPVLGVEKARVQSVGLTKYNTLDLPHNIHDTGWYTQSGFPGQGYGAVVIDGYSNGVSHNGAFFGLGQLKKDDEITIERGDGKKFKYLVVANQTLSLQQANTSGMQQLMTPFDKTKEGLGLITTSGNWVPRDKVYDKRVLIRAVAE